MNDRAADSPSGSGLAGPRLRKLRRVQKLPPATVATATGVTAHFREPGSARPVPCPGSDAAAQGYVPLGVGTAHAPPVDPRPPATSPLQEFR
jgi:hypothetical protein